MKKFITFEGGEGTGKSTQAKALFNSFRKITKNIVLTREPGGTSQSELIRDILVKEQDKEWNPLTELLLINASRNEHIKKLIIPALKRKIVICDRFLDSTKVYQVNTKCVDEKIFIFLNKIIVGDLEPKITFLIDLDPKIGLERTRIRKSGENRFENYNVNFHKKIRKAFLLQAKKNKKRIILLDGNLSKVEIHKQIINKINKLSFFKKILPYTLK